MPGQMPMQHGQMPYGQQPAYGQGPPMGGQPMYQQPGMMMTPQQPQNPNGENWMAVPQGIWEGVQNRETETKIMKACHRNRCIMFCIQFKKEVRNLIFLKLFFEEI